MIGATTYVTSDAVSDLLMYHTCAQLVQEHATKHEIFLKTIGSSPSDLKLGPWYDSSVKFSYGGMLATVTMPARGAKGSDVIVRVRHQHIDRNITTSRYTNA